MTNGTFQREERLRSVQLRRGKSGVVPAEKPVPWRVGEGEAVDEETRDRVRRMSERHVAELRPRIRGLEQTAILWDGAKPPHDAGPHCGKVVVRNRGELVPGVTAHFIAV